MSTKTRVKKSHRTTAVRSTRKFTGESGGNVSLAGKSLQDPELEEWIMVQMGNILVRGVCSERAARQIAVTLINEHPEVDAEAKEWRNLAPYAKRVLAIWAEQSKELAPYQRTWVEALLMESIRISRSGDIVEMGDGTKEKIRPNARSFLESIRSYAQVVGVIEQEDVRTPTVNNFIGNVDISLLQNVPEDVIEVANNYAKEIRAAAAASIRKRELPIATVAKQESRKIG